jgi:drug/metabolite transporter (DMT)-like permease
MLLITRARLAGVDPGLTTWHTMGASTVLLVAALLGTGTWQPPAGAAGWAALLATSVTTTVGILALFASAARIGPFRTALMMNLEPVISSVLSVAFLGDRLTAPQLAGAAVMVAALCAFQIRR